MICIKVCFSVSVPPLLSTTSPGGPPPWSPKAAQWMPPISRCQSLPVSRPAATPLQPRPTCPVTTSTLTTDSATSACPPTSAWPPRRGWCGSCTSGSSGTSSVTAAPLPPCTPGPTSPTRPPSESPWRCPAPSLSPRPRVKSHRPSPPRSNRCPLAGHTLPQTDAQSGPWMRWHPGTTRDPAPPDICVHILPR